MAMTAKLALDRIAVLDTQITDFNKTLNLLEDKMYPTAPRDCLKVARVVLETERGQLSRRMEKTTLVEL